MTRIAVQTCEQDQQAGVPEPTPTEFVDKKHEHAGDHDLVREGQRGERQRCASNGGEDQTGKPGEQR